MSGTNITISFSLGEYDRFMEAVNIYLEAEKELGGKLLSAKERMERMLWYSRVIEGKDF